jgi:hypothetical protein
MSFSGKCERCGVKIDKGVRWCDKCFVEWLKWIKREDILFSRMDEKEKQNIIDKFNKRTRKRAFIYR